MTAATGSGGLKPERGRIVRPFTGDGRSRRGRGWALCSPGPEVHAARTAPPPSGKGGLTPLLLTQDAYYGLNCVSPKKARVEVLTFGTPEWDCLQRGSLQRRSGENEIVRGPQIRDGWRRHQKNLLCVTPTEGSPRGDKARRRPRTRGHRGPRRDHAGRHLWRPASSRTWYPSQAARGPS